MTMEMTEEEEGEAVSDFIKRFDLFVTELSLLPTNKLKDVISFIDERLQVIKYEIESAMDFDDPIHDGASIDDTLDDEIKYFVDEKGNLIDTRNDNQMEHQQGGMDDYEDTDCKEEQKTCVPQTDNVTKKLWEDKRQENEIAELQTSKPVARKRNVWYCDACDEKFEKKKLFTEHNKTVHQGELVYSCSLCPKSFLSQQGLECHIESRHPKQPNSTIECPEDGCGYQTHSKVCMRSHRISAHVKSGPYKCPICNKEYFGGPKAFRHHMQMHTGDLNYSCETCGKRFVSSSRLSYHIKQVHEAAKFQCETCAKVFKSKVNFERHVLIHTNAKPFKCPMCPYCSNTSGNLSVHVRRKHGQKDFTTGMQEKKKKKEMLTKTLSSKHGVTNQKTFPEVLGYLETNAYLDDMAKLDPGKSVPSIEQLKEIEVNNELLKKTVKRERKVPMKKMKPIVIKEDLEERADPTEYYTDGNEQVVTLTNEKGEVIKAVINIGSTVEIQAFENEPIVETYESQAIVEDGVVELTENVIIEEEVESSDMQEVDGEVQWTQEAHVVPDHHVVVDPRIVPTPVKIQRVKRVNNSDNVIIYQHIA